MPPESQFSQRFAEPDAATSVSSPRRFPLGGRSNSWLQHEIAVTSVARRRRAMGQILLLTAGFLGLVAIRAASVLLVGKARDDSAWVVHTIRAENQLNALLLEIRRAESAARGYQLTRGAEFLADHDAAVAAIMPEFDALRGLLADNARQVENVAGLSSAIATRLDQFGREIRLIKQGDEAGAMALVRDVAVSNATATIRATAEAMRTEEELLLAQRSA